MDKRDIIQELEREMQVRQQVYPALIRNGKLHPHLAARRNRALQAAIDFIKGTDAPKVEQKSLF